MHFLNQSHLAYCTNVHPAESWQETLAALKEHTLKVRNELLRGRDTPFAIGLRLSAKAATDLLAHGAAELAAFENWLLSENCYVFTINGFPYDDFHGVEVKERVYQPDWTTAERLAYTLDLFTIISRICPKDSGGSVSTLPGSFKEFGANEDQIFANLYACAESIRDLSESSGKDLHLGLEPEPLGHFENLEETLAFFGRFRAWASVNGHDGELITRHVGVNYDTCHFALEYEDCATSLQAFREAGIRISKIHLSNALSIDPRSSDAISRIRDFIEPTYLHQVLLQNDAGDIVRFKDLPQFFAAIDDGSIDPAAYSQACIHFHIPLYSDPAAPLGSTRDHAADALAFAQANADICKHFEIETYTWAVLPDELQRPLVDMLCEEYRWTLKERGHSVRNG